MKLTLEMIEAHCPCPDGLQWYKDHGTQDLLETLLKVNKVNAQWSRWLFTKLGNKKQSVEIAIYCAELVIDIFKKKYPDDKRPRLAIAAAKDWLANPSDAAYASASTAADASAAAAHAARAAAAAETAAYAAYANKLNIQEKIIHEAVRILERGSE